MTDPNNWTKSYVQANAAACVEFLIETNRRISSMLYEKNYAAAIAGMDRVLNGLVTMQNAGCGNFGSHIAVMSFAEGTVIAFGEVEYNGKTASEANRRATAIKAFEDARDFASSEQLKSTAAQVISLLKSGQSLASIAQEQELDLPEEAIDGVDTVTRQLEKLLASGAVAKKKGKGCLVALIALLLIGGYMLYLYFVPQETHQTPMTAAQTTTEAQLP